MEDVLAYTRKVCAEIPLFPHQRDIANRCYREYAVGVFCEQGTGKTRPVLCSLTAKPDAFPALIVCPKTVIDVWVREAKQWIGIEPVVFRGTKAQRAKMLNEAGGQIWVTNFDTLRTYNYAQFKHNQHTGRKYKVHDNYVRAARPWRTVIVDESSKIKHHTSGQSRACHAFARAPYRYILTGTAITHSPLDLFSQFRFLEPDVYGSSWYEFQHSYATIIKRPLPQGHSSRFTHFESVNGYKNLEDLYARARPYVVQYKKEDCLKLPPKIYQQQTITLSSTQRRDYNSLVKEYVAFLTNSTSPHLSSTLTAPNVVSRLLKLQEICQGFVILENNSIHTYKKNPKLTALGELLENVTSSAKAVVWCRFKFDVKAVYNLCKERGYRPVVIAGDVAMEDRERAVQTFQNGDAKVIVCQIDTAAFGLTLTAATYAIYYSQNFNADVRRQSEDRIHRIGTKGKCTFIDLVCEQTVDETIVANLKTKDEFQGQFDATRFTNAAKGVRYERSS